MALDRADGALASYCLDDVHAGRLAASVGVMAQTLEVVASADGGDV